MPAEEPYLTGLSKLMLPNPTLPYPPRQAVAMLAHTLYVVWAAGADVHGELKAANPERKAALAPLSNIYTARWRVVRGLAAAMTLTALVLHLSRYRPTPVATPKMWELAAFHPKPAPPEMDGGGMDFWDGRRELSFMAHLMDDSHVAPMVRLVRKLPLGKGEGSPGAGETGVRRVCTPSLTRCL